VGKDRLVHYNWYQPKGSGTLRPGR